MLLLIDLIIGFGNEIWVWQRVLGIDRLAVIRGERYVCRMMIGGRKCDFRLDIQQLTHLAADGLIEIKEIIPSILEKRADVVLIILEEGRLSICTH